MANRAFAKPYLDVVEKPVAQANGWLWAHLKGSLQTCRTWYLIVLLLVTECRQPGHTVSACRAWLREALFWVACGFFTAVLVAVLLLHVVVVFPWLSLYALYLSIIGPVYLALGALDGVGLVLEL